MTLKHSLLALILMGAVACGGGSSEPTPVTEGDDDIPLDIGNGASAPAPYNGITWDVQPVESGGVEHPFGDMGKLAKDSDGTMYYAYLINEASTNSDCENLAVFSGTTQVPGLRYQLHIARKPAGGTFSSTIERLPVEDAANVGTKTAQGFIGARLGLDAIVNDAGELLVVTPGGTNGQFTCASSDLLFGKRATDGTYTLSSVATSSGDCCQPCPPQSACDQGTDVGAFPAIAIRQNGVPAISYLDTHFTTDNDGKTHADFELVNTTGSGAGTFEPIDLWSGLGYWGTLRFSGSLGIAAGSSVVANGNGSPSLFRSTTAGTWTEVDLQLTGQLQGRVQLEKVPDAVEGVDDHHWGLAYYETNDSRGASTNDLVFCESFDDGLTWTSCDRPENALLVAGAQPSLTFDPQGRPLLSYYYCGSGNCVHDGLRFAWRDDNGLWWKFNVHNIDNNRSGFWSSVQVNDAGEPTIVFQDLSNGRAMAAIGHFNQ